MSRVPSSTGLKERKFKLAKPGKPFVSPGKPLTNATSAWRNPGPASDPIQVRLGDGSLVTYRWYRFIDQPSFQQYRRAPYSWSEEK